MWFTKKYKNKIEYLEQALELKNRELKQAEKGFKTKESNYQESIKSLVQARTSLKSLVKELKSKEFHDLMIESLGLPIDFSVVNDKCLPLHFLSDLEGMERRNFVNHMETIYNDEKFQKVVKYMINLFATNAVYKRNEKEMKYGQIAVVAFRTLLKEFDKMHSEFLSYKKGDEEFDDQAILPE